MARTVNIRAKNRTNRTLEKRGSRKYNKIHGSEIFISIERA